MSASEVTWTAVQAGTAPYVSCSAEKLIQERFRGSRILIADDAPVILMDMQMPNVDGLEATRKIREIPGHLNTPIIAMTANTSIEDQTSCFEAGMSDFMAKPFHPNRLFVNLLHWLSLGGQAQPSTASTNWRPAS